MRATGIRSVRPNQGTSLPYNTLSTVDIYHFPISEFADKDCLLFLWTPDKYLMNAHIIMGAWGFKKHCTFVWNKPTGVCPFSVQFCNEFCLMGYKGKFHLNKIGLKTWFNAPVREHSRKPDELYQIAEQLGDPPRIDIFSREKREGWDQYGDQPDYFI